jgi:hypothetical protein
VRPAMAPLSRSTARIVQRSVPRRAMASWTDRSSSTEKVKSSSSRASIGGVVHHVDCLGVGLQQVVRQRAVDADELVPGCPRALRPRPSGGARHGGGPPSARGCGARAGRPRARPQRRRPPPAPPPAHRPCRACAVCHRHGEDGGQEVGAEPPDAWLLRPRPPGPTPGGGCRCGPRAPPQTCRAAHRLHPTPAPWSCASRPG